MKIPPAPLCNPSGNRDDEFCQFIPVANCPRSRPGIEHGSTKSISHDRSMTRPQRVLSCGNFIRCIFRRPEKSHVSGAAEARARKSQVKLTDIFTGEVSRLSTSGVRLSDLAGRFRARYRGNSIAYPLALLPPGREKSKATEPDDEVPRGERRRDAEKGGRRAEFIETH